MYLHVSVDVAAERVFECAASGHGGIAERVGADEEHQSVLRQEATAAPDQGASTSSWRNFEVKSILQSNCCCPFQAQLFKFNSSSHAISMDSYMRAQRQEFYMVHFSDYPI